VCLDVGTSTVKAALAEVNSGQDLNILGISQAPSFGMRKGNIVDIENTARSIENCLDELERLTGQSIDSTLISFSATNVMAIKNNAVVGVGNSSGAITEEDKDRSLQSALKINLPTDKTIIQMIERQYIVDGYDGIKDPVGMVGNRLEAEVVLIAAPTAAWQNLQRSMQRINLQVERIAFRPLLVAESVLLTSEMEMGVVLVDIGAGTTEISFFESGSLANASVLPVGGEYITKDLAIVLRTSIDEARRIKESHGIASPELARNDLIIEIKDVLGKENKQISQQVVAEIISARVIEIFEMIYAELKELGCPDQIPGGIVLTGGESKLAGIARIGEELINIPVRLGSPGNILGISAEFNHPQHAAVLGGIKYAVRNWGDDYEPKEGISHVLSKISYWLQDLFS